MKTCTKCGETKLLSDFHLSRRSPDGRDYRCKECQKLNYRLNKDKKLKQTRLWKQQNEQKHLNNILESTYGITLYDYNKILQSQDGVCNICGQPPSVRKHLAVDHDHDTGAVRGLLCHKCNVSLGHFKDTKILEAAIKHIKTAPKKAELYGLLRQLGRGL